MAIKKEITLPNGMVLKYHVINSVKLDSTSMTILVNSFVDKSYFDKAMEEYQLKQKQEELITEFDKLQLKKSTKTIETKLEKIAKEINELADKISLCKNYNNYVAQLLTVNIDPITTFTETAIEEELIKRKII